MKKLICIILVLAFTFAFCACETSTKTENNDNSKDDFSASQNGEDDLNSSNDDLNSSQISGPTENDQTPSEDEDDSTVSQPEKDENDDNNDSFGNEPQDPCAKGHNFTEKRVESTCTKKGSVTKTCSRCGKIETTELSLKAHSRKDSYTKLNSTQHQKVSTCSVCGDVATKKENHSWGQWTTTKKPTTSATGEKTRSCKLCGQSVTESIPKLEAAEQEIPQRILELVNIEREKAGLAPLQYYNAGQSAADIRAEEIIETFSHTRPDGTECFTVLEGIHYMAAGENIALGHRTPEQVMQGWMNSPGHKENILRDYFTHLIVGYDDEAKAWVQLFLTLH